jgi:hypothetical protein
MSQSVLSPIAILKQYIESPFKDGTQPRKIDMKEMKDLPKEDRDELAKLAAAEMGYSWNGTAYVK